MVTWFHFARLSPSELPQALALLLTPTLKRKDSLFAESRFPFLNRIKHPYDYSTFPIYI